jgi:hypothetical protein
VSRVGRRAEIAIPAFVAVAVAGWPVSLARSPSLTWQSCGRTVSRDALADQIRQAGHGISNARASQLLKALHGEG